MNNESVSQPDLLEHTAHQSLDFHKTIQNSHREEEYARDCWRIMAKLNKKWQDKELAQASVPTSFPDPISSDKKSIPKSTIQKTDVSQLIDDFSELASSD